MIFNIMIMKLIMTIDDNDSDDNDSDDNNK